MSDDPSVIVIGHVLEEKFEGCRNVGVITFGPSEFLPDDRTRFCAACLPHDVVYDAEEGRGNCPGEREHQTPELTNLEKYSVMRFSLVTLLTRSSRARSCRRQTPVGKLGGFQLKQVQLEGNPTELKISVGWER